MYLRARYYEPTIGRFISEDGAKDGYNWYAYCGNDPVNRVDPSGNILLTATLTAIAIGALSGAIIGAGFDIGSQLLFGGATLSTIDWASVGASAISGAFTGAVGAATGGVGTLGGLSYYGAYSAITDQQITIRGAATAAVSGAISGAVGYGISKAIGYFVNRSSYSTPKPVNVNGKSVYLDDAIFDPNFIDKQGRTNIQRMQQGLTPIGTDGKSVHIHHIDQTDNGPVMEILASRHQNEYSILHSNIGNAPSQINRKLFNTWRGKYWQWRAGCFG